MNKQEGNEVAANDSVDSDLNEAVTAVVNETVTFLETLGKAVVTAAQDLSNLMVIHVDADTRKDLDLLVDAGLATSRRDAAGTLLDAGVRAQRATFDRIHQTQTQIQELRQQIRALVDVGAT